MVRCRLVESHEKHIQISRKKGGVFEKFNFEKKHFSVFSIYLKNYSLFKIWKITWKVVKFRYDNLGQNYDHLKKMRIFIFKITLSQCNFLYRATGLQNYFSTKRKRTGLMKFNVEYDLRVSKKSNFNFFCSLNPFRMEILYGNYFKLF